MKRREKKKMSDNSQEKGNQSGSAKRGFIIIAIFLVIIIALVAVIAFLLGRNANSGSDAGTEPTGNEREVAESARVVLDENSAATIMDEMRKEVEEGMFECNMSMTWTFADGTSESKDAIVVNSNNNSYPFYFDVTLNDSDELIYSSPVVPVGSQLTNFKLDKDLEPGEYMATVMYSLLEDETSQEVKSQAGFVITIIVYE
jgi:hypothetical protein